LLTSELDAKPLASTGRNELLTSEWDAKSLASAGRKLLASELDAKPLASTERNELLTSKFDKEFFCVFPTDQYDNRTSEEIRDVGVPLRGG